MLHEPGFGRDQAFGHSIIRNKPGSISLSQFSRLHRILLITPSAVKAPAADLGGTLAAPSPQRRRRMAEGLGSTRRLQAHRIDPPARGAEPPRQGTDPLSVPDAAAPNRGQASPRHVCDMKINNVIYQWFNVRLRDV